MAKNSKASTSITRRVSFSVDGDKSKTQAYPHPKYFRMFIAHARSNLYGRAEEANMIIKDYFDRNFTELERQKLMRIFDKMTPEEIERPGRI